MKEGEQDHAITVLKMKHEENERERVEKQNIRADEARKEKRKEEEKKEQAEAVRLHELAKSDKKTADAVKLAHETIKVVGKGEEIINKMLEKERRAVLEAPLVVA